MRPSHVEVAPELAAGSIPPFATYIGCRSVEGEFRYSADGRATECRGGDLTDLATDSRVDMAGPVQGQGCAAKLESIAADPSRMLAYVPLPAIV
jgi:hypothetical protein